jgi:tRNA (cmo5U34)-methyltransferase
LFARRLVTEIAARYVKDNTFVVDLGCSLGAQLEPLVERFGAYARYLGADCSQPMLDGARDRMRGYAECGLVQLQKIDLRSDFPRVHRASVFLSVLTLQFTPVEYRTRIASRVYERLNPGGAFVVVEKLLGATGESDELFTDLYYAHKSEQGYGPEEIARKRESLEGVLVPLTAQMNEQLLRDAGFARVECFWRWCNFAGFLAVK